MTGSGSHLTEPVAHRFAASSGPICWYEWGDPAAPPILLLHATGFHARCWDAVVAGLPAGYRVIAPDFRGHGNSYRPESLADWQASARDMIELVEALDLRDVTGVGHSMGGQCMVQLAAAMPVRFARLILIDPVIFPPNFYDDAPSADSVDPDSHMVARRRNSWESAGQMEEHFADRHPYRLWQRRVLADYCHYGLLPAGDGEGLELACPPRLEASVYLGSCSFNPWPMVPGISCPVLVLRAQAALPDAPHDFANSPTPPDLAAHFQQGEDRHLAHLTHFMPMQAPDLIAGIIAEQLAIKR
ncbi:MAG: alpha/beta hydrolase [Blastomonas sp.]